jgi:hypothetical protein
VQADTVFNMTVFLGPGDVWNAAVNRNASTGLAQIVSSDSSCTLPSLANGAAVSFSDARLNPRLNAAERAAQTREGYVEIINMADITPAASTLALYNAVGTARQCDSAAIAATQVDTDAENVAAAMGFAGPTGGIRASWTLINVAQTLTFTGPAFALQGIDPRTGAAGRGNYMFYPQTGLSAGNVDMLSADPLFRKNPKASKTYDGLVTTFVAASLPLTKPTLADLPDLSTPYMTGNLDPMAYISLISQTFVAKAVSNDYATDPAINAATDWLFSMPTKRYSMAMDYLQGLMAYNVMTAPSTYEYFSSDNNTLQNGKMCSTHRFVFFDREEVSRNANTANTLTGQFIKLCGAAALMSFGDANAQIPTSLALGASLTVENTEKRAFVNGWGNIDVISSYTGMPVLGMAFTKASNPNASPGVSGNYGLTLNHRFTR